MIWMRLRETCRRLLVPVTFALLGATSTRAADARPGSRMLVEGPVVIEKVSPPLSDRARTFLRQRDSDSALVWVFFTDKGVVDRTGFEAAAADVSVTERAWRRRAKVGVERVVFADLPVREEYLQELIGLGAIHRRSSRWLNAASFELSFELLEIITELPFIVAITPVARFARFKDEEDRPRKNESGFNQALGDLNYGPSQAQILQINAALAHSQGFTGRGVTLTITDTGFRKSHQAFASAADEGRVLAEYDFVSDDDNTSQEVGDQPGQWNHGTLTWSVAGGFAPGQIIGPAFGANFILCKTEDTGSETPVEEDNWVAALQFADSVGTDVISTSLSYSDWYDYSDMDGLTAVITIAANTCDALGIVLCTSAGNAGPVAGSVRAPADGFDILAIGAVDAGGALASFSSRGPTFDGRIKPEVCALGVETYAASAGTDQSYQRASGTSLSCPLVAGAAGVLIEARPELTPALIRQALMATADRAADPDSGYGWGVINLGEALTWPVAFEADSIGGQVPLTVRFTNQSWLEATGLLWQFGDGQTSTEAAPVYQYDVPGLYDVTLTIDTEQGQFARTASGLISVHADTLRIEHVLAEPATSVSIDVQATNFLPLKEIVIPFSYQGELDVTYDSFSTAGLRTEYFSTQSLISFDAVGKRAAIFLRAAGSEAEPPLAPGDGPIATLFFRVPYQLGTGYNPVELLAYGPYRPVFRSAVYEYGPAIEAGSIRLGCCFGSVGNADGEGGETPTIGDIIAIIDAKFISGTCDGIIECPAEADVNRSGGSDPACDDITIGDIALLVDYLFITGPTLGLPDCP